MYFFRRYPKFVKITCLASVSAGAGWLYYQVRNTQNILNNALDTSILSIAEPSITEQPENGDFFFIDITKVQESQDFSFGSTWTNLKFLLAKRLLFLANNENKYIRKKAVRQLARIRNLENWHFSVLSDMIDARTAVGLARTSNADPRLFTEPPVPYFAHTQNMMVEQMKDLLINLHTKSQHPCMGFFISRAFIDLHDTERFSDHETPSIELKKFIRQNTDDVLPLCLESLVHHASIENYAKDIAELNGLPLLMEIHNRFKDNVNITATICKIISFLSMHRDLLEKLHKSGWIKLLAEWVRHDDVKVSIPASKALANLDIDEEPIYFQRLYPLYPSTRTVRTPSADIVFVHGLLGGVFYTWRQRKRNQELLGFLGKKGPPESLTPENLYAKLVTKRKKAASSDPDLQDYMENFEEHVCNENLCVDYDIVWEDIPTNTNTNASGPYCCPGKDFSHNKNDEDCYTYCWPRDWLARDCNHLRIIGVNYETNLTMWTAMCPFEKAKTLEERSNELMDQLSRVGLGKRPIVWVTHSMGGLMVKNLLIKASESGNKKFKDICLNTKGLVFYSTPHTGSNVANLNSVTSLVIWPSTEVQELQENSPKLYEIHKKFLKLTKKIPMKIVTFIETKPIVISAIKFKFLIVNPDSGNPGVGEYYEIPLDHLGICKPASRQSFFYQKVLHMILDILKDEKVVN